MSNSIDTLFKCPYTLERLHKCGYLSSYLDPFAEWLEKQQFPHSTKRKHISNVAHLSHSLKGIETDIGDINQHIQRFYEHMSRCKCKGWRKPKNTIHITHSFSRFKLYLSERYGISFKSENLAYEEIYNEYLCWLNEKFKLENSTIELRASYLKQFLHWYKKASGYKSIQTLTPNDIESFFITATSRWGRAYKRSLQATLRSFFDFCFEHKYTLQNLRFSLPVIKSYRLSEVPKKIDEGEAAKLIQSIDQSTPGGKRTYAILQLINNYGIRGCQVNALRLKDIDWHKEEIYFPAVKYGKSNSFPLLTDVGNALLDYLTVRKKSTFPEVFLTLHAPYRPLKDSGMGNILSQTIREAMLKAKINSSSKGVYCFRHGFVSRMLKQGESFKSIADLLGHKHIQTTFIYTKIDFNSLAEVALELPEVEYENY